MNSRIRFWLAAVIVLIGVLLPQVVLAAVSISRAELSSGRLRVEGSGATPNATMTVDGIVMGNADGGGSFRLERNGFSSLTCVITVSDGTTSAQSNLSGCTPTTPPTPAPTPTPPPTGGLSAPTLTAPANGAAVVQPFLISWSTVANATAYNFEISSDPTFAGNVYQYISGANAPTTQASISGFDNGTYYWRVLAAISGNPVVISPFSVVGTFVVTGNAPTVLPAPTLIYPTTGVQIHPLELLIARWTSVPGAATYLLEMDDQLGFFLPGGYSTFPNIPNTRTDQGFAVADPQTIYLRVRAIAADGTRSTASAPQQVLVSYNAPLPPPVTLATPANGATINLPVTFDWSDVPNNQTDGYELQIDNEPGFPGGVGSIELQVSPIAVSQYTLNSLGAGTHYWRVRSSHGASAPNVGAFSAYSEVRSFIIPATGPTLIGFTTNTPSAFSGQVIPFNDPIATVQLNAPAPAGGALVTLVSSNPAVLTMPANVTVPAGEASFAFRITPGQVEVDTPVTLSASFGATTLTVNFLVRPSSLNRLEIGNGIGTLTVLGGSQVAGLVFLNGQAPAGTAINLSSNNPAVSVPAILNPVAGQSFGNFAINTSNVAALSTVTLSANWRGATVQSFFTVAPNVAPTLLAPADGASFATNQLVTFDWADLPGASTYAFEVDTDSAFAAPIPIQLTDTGSEMILGQAALPQGTLFWRVQGRGGVGTVTPWSQVRSIQFGSVVAPTPTPPPPTADTVAIQQAEYRQSRQRLSVQATSTNATATLQLFVTSTNQLLGTLTNNGGGRYSASISNVTTNPQNITVRSNRGGVASRAVTVR